MGTKFAALLTEMRAPAQQGQKARLLTDFLTSTKVRFTRGLRALVR